MSVLIRGMKMPETCADCNLSTWNGFESVYCDVNAEFIPRKEWKEKRQNWCPLVDVPSADVVKVKHGKWLPSTCEYSNYNYDCSVCGCNEYRQIGRNGRYRGFDFCPNCGARMDGGT